MKQFFKKYSHIWTALYAFIYMPWFLWLENTIVTDYTPIHIWIDDVIPFCEYFIIPYYMWFLYVAAGMIFLFFSSKKDYYRECMFLFTGMTIFLIICTIYPNGQDLRADLSNADSVFTSAVYSLYQTDTNTNVFPSIHVFNSIGIMIGILKSQWLKGKRCRIPIQVCSVVLTVSITLSTVFLKQHSCIDVIGAVIMAIALYFIVYVPDWKFLSRSD